MDNLVTSPQDIPLAGKPKRKRIDTKRMAWVVLSMAFVGFCLVCVSTSFAVYYYLFQSDVSMAATVKVANRGTVGLVGANLSERFEYNEEDVQPGDTLLTDAQSQSVISFRDPRMGVVAAITMKNDSELRIERMTKPRFEMGQRNYRLVVADIRGELDIFVPDTLARPANITLILPDGAVVDVAESGLYTLALGEQQAHLNVRRGKAAIVPPNREASRSVIDNEIGVYDMDSGDVTIATGHEDLIVNNIFAQPPVSIQDVENGVGSFELWNCADRTYNDRPGMLEWKVFEGRLALHVHRRNTDTHGETGCIQPLGSSAQAGRFVGDYNFLSLRATFSVQSHSLNACGVVGSECPVMLQVDYIDTDGDRNTWYQGFYTHYDPTLDYPLRCNSSGCEEHKRVNEGAWYSYESGNLFSLLTDAVPESILNVQFYASGHEYDVYLSELSLLAAVQPTEAATTLQAD